ncbi:hypothetical protein [Methylomonas rapida]|uniref:Phage tail collar domain-containing protein n=1 Tax=Methylomonas rapida TaxID=2963939 RepID=A0ABY7GE83_9GAMM|nr:hypothetical protein [Methylomonas rapida]WAR43590.1 hypothetical protein NM686_014545 [Methylomonas rapida]WAR45461.1 hypothetical protein NM686_002815 [Methylomonas rapida]
MRKISGAGHVLNQFVTEDAATNRPPTEVTDIWLNDVQNELAAAAQKDGAALGESDHQLADVLGARIRHFATGEALPNANIGPIWHDDYNSIMIWQAFTANGAAYTGYASVLVGNLLLDTQPTPRAGYIKSGVANLSRTAYAALRGWAMHNGIMVAEGTWAAGTIAVKDNADGTTFTAFDVRGEFPRFLDDGRGVDSGRAIGSWQSGTQSTFDAVSDSTMAGISSNSSGRAGIGLDAYPEYTSGTYIHTIGGATNSAAVTGSLGTTRPRNIALLACIKY